MFISVVSIVFSTVIKIFFLIPAPPIFVLSASLLQPIKMVRPLIFENKILHNW